MKESHVYRNYSSGEPSTRLYVKNLAKQVEEKVRLHPGTVLKLCYAELCRLWLQDLRYIFGRYINWDVEMQKNMLVSRFMV